MEQSPSWEAKSHSSSQQIPTLSWNPTVHNSSPLAPILSQMNPALIITQYLFKLNFIISSVGIALDYGLEDRGARVRLPAGAGNVSLHHRVQNGSGAHPASYLMGTRGLFPWE
jgi:hypothetical protein